MKRIAICLLSILSFYSGSATSDEARPRNIILMIGDGMGVAQVTAGHTLKGTLALESFKHVGLVLTQAHGADYITDSAASATAMATGVQSYNGAISVDPDAKPVKTVFEYAKERGIRTGLVATCSITHATPACFVAHVTRRAMQLDIARQISEGDTDLYLGSGWRWFVPQERGGRRTDGRDLLEEMHERGYAYVWTDSAFGAIDAEHTGKLIGLFAPDHFGPAPDRHPSLREMTATAIECLSSSDNGFVLMVEGSQIDWAGHDNDAALVPVEMVDFDDAIEVAVAFAKRDGQTLVVVTADHETGGYAIVDGSVNERRVEGRFAAGHHTGTMIPLFALGPGAEQFGGIISSDAIGRQLIDFVK